MLFRYGVVALLSGLVDFGVYTVIVAWCPSIYLLASAASFICATYLNFRLSARFVFLTRNYPPFYVRGIRTFSVSVVALVCGSIMLYLLVESTSFDLLLSKLLTMAATFGINYSGRKYYAFR